jgi:hypothetical protein
MVSTSLYQTRWLPEPTPSRSHKIADWGSLGGSHVCGLSTSTPQANHLADGTQDRRNGLEDLRNRI